MSTEQKLNLMKARYARLTGSIKNIKCPGVARKLLRQIRNLDK